MQGFWWQEDGGDIDYAGKKKFSGIAAVRLPDFIKEKDVVWAAATEQRKKKIDFRPAYFMMLEERLCVQMMHMGVFDNELATVHLMNEYLEQKGYENDFSSERGPS